MPHYLLEKHRLPKQPKFRAENSEILAREVKNLTNYLNHYSLNIKNAIKNSNSEEMDTFEKRLQQLVNSPILAELKQMQVEMKGLNPDSKKRRNKQRIFFYFKRLRCYLDNLIIQIERPQSQKPSKKTKVGPKKSKDYGRCVVAIRPLYSNKMLGQG